ncbi:Uma2 family endonuclease [Leptothoe sp. EHU-05/26/07-4]
MPILTLNLNVHPRKKRSRWEPLNPTEQQKFPPIAPDFVIELRSASDSLATLQTKMQEYQANGVCLGWLLNPQDQTVEIYRPRQPVEILKSPLPICMASAK